MTGAAACAIFLMVGDVIIRFMEAGAFRGLMLPHFLQRMRGRAANLLQAGLFCAWHLVLVRQGQPDRPVRRRGAHSGWPALGRRIRCWTRLRPSLPAHGQSLGALDRPFPEQHNPQPRKGSECRRSAAARGRHGSRCCFRNGAAGLRRRATCEMIGACAIEAVGCRRIRVSEIDRFAHFLQMRCRSRIGLLSRGERSFSKPDGYRESSRANVCQSDQPLMLPGQADAGITRFLPDPP
jgi:hypothetical protein